MSSTQEIKEIIDIYDTMLIADYCIVATAAWIFHEAIVTLSSEIECFWKRRRASVLYILNKYSAIAYTVLTLAPYIPMTDESCDRTLKAALAFGLLQFIPWAVFSAQRTFALSKNRFLSALVLALLLVPAGANLWQYLVIDVVGYIDPIAGCVQADNGTIETAVKAVLISRVCTIVADVLVIAVTILKTPWKQQMRTTHASLSSILLYDGIACFSLLLVLNALHLGFTLGSIFGSDQGSYVTAFTSTCMPILLGRFLLHLQESGSRTLRGPAGDVDDALRFDHSISSRPSFVKPNSPPTVYVIQRAAFANAGEHQHHCIEARLRLHDSECGSEVDPRLRY